MSNRPMRQESRLPFAPEALLPEQGRVAERRAPVNLLFHLLDQMREGFLFIDTEGTLRLVNPKGAALVKKSLESLEGNNYWAHFSDSYFGFSMRESLRYGMSYPLLYKSDPSQELEWEITSFFLYDPIPQEQGLMLLIRDLQERQKLEQKAARFDRMKELGEMAAKLAHEIRNPLGGIRGFAMLLHRDLAAQPHLQQMAGQVVEGTKTIEEWATHVLQYARPVQIAPKTVDLVPLLKQLGQWIQADPAFPPNVQWTLHLPNQSLFAPVDPSALRGALLNLLVNGWQAMPEGGKLSVVLLKGISHCQIEISDTGVGMDEKQLASLFSPLFTTKKGGNGLGLTEVKKIVEAHNGTVEVRSHLGKGSTFTIHLPLRR